MEWLFLILRLRNKFCFCMRIRPSVRTGFMIIFSISIAMLVGILIVYFTLSKPKPSCEFTFRRMMKSSIVSSSQPRSVAVGDLNNDHQMDIVVANSGNNTIGIFLSTGNGTFKNQQTYPSGSESHPSSVVIGHFNNDHYLDTAVANYATNNIGICLGKGDGTFSDQREFSTGSSHPLFVTVADLNNDNQTDIIVANYGTNSVGVLLGYGNGSFQQQTTYSTDYDSIPHSLALGDFNHDNHLDIAVANYGTDNIGIFLGYGNGTFASQKIYTTLHNSNPSSIVVGDFNNDKQLDIVVSNNGSGNVGIFLGYGNGSFQSQIIYPMDSTSHPEYITVGDLNNDNELDIVTTDLINDRVYILRGYGNGSFATITTYDTTAGSSPMSVVVGDFNNNNQSDIVIANYGTNNVLVLMDYRIQPSTRQTNYNIGPSGITTIAVSDFNNDHIPDIVSSYRYQLFIINGLNDGVFDGESISSINMPVQAAQYICVGDINNDNWMDIITANPYDDNVGVMLGRGNGTFASMKTYSTGSGSLPVWTALGDLNNDGRLDIICANSNSDNIGILLGNGDGTFAIMISYSTRLNSHPMSVAVGDINNDNRLDIVVAGLSGYVVVFLGHDDGTFTRVTRFQAGSGALSIVLADFNSDSYLDIAVANTFAFNIGVCLGYGNGTFTIQTEYSCSYGCYLYNVIVADFNNDNISDIAAVVHNDDEILIFYGYGDGSFTLARTYSTGLSSSPYGIAVADFDNNKQLEIVVSLWGTGDVAVLIEYLAAEFVHEVVCFTGSTSQPSSVAVGDFNHDNRSDVVVANSGTGDLSVLLSARNGTFGMEIKYLVAADSQPKYVITCDINKDEQLDIVSVNSKSNSISIFMGMGNGTFANETAYLTGNNSHPYAVTSGDLNNDGRLDLVIANEGTDNIGVLFGFNYSTFQSPVVYSSDDSFCPIGIIVSDFNKDNFLDIAAVFEGNSKLGIYLGCGNGSFILTITYPMGNNMQPLAIDEGDLNNDSRVDVVVSDIITNQICILLGYGNGSFAGMQMYLSGGSFPISVAVGDLNNDHRLDIVVANRDTDNVGVLFGYGNGNFSTVKLYSTGLRSQPSSITLCDLNDDHQLDIVVANTNTDSVGVLFGYGNGTLQGQVILSMVGGTAPLWVTVGDFNNDTLLDIATANSNDQNVGILLGNGNGTVAPMTTYSLISGSTPYYMNTGDFNSDNILDIAVVDSGTNNIVVLFGVGDGTFLLGTMYTTGIGSVPQMLAAGDFNNDTRLDIAVINFYANNTLVFLGGDNEPYASDTTYPTGSGSHPHSVALGDFNSDQRMDIIVANYGTDSVGVLLGRGKRQFSSVKTYPVGNGSAPYSVAVADFNNDNYLDVVVSNSETDNILILLGYGNGTFRMGTTYSTGALSRPYTVVISDFNRDNISDIAVANSGTSNIFLLYGYGNGTFGNETSYPLGYGYHPYSIAAADLNDDGRMDIVIACFDTDHIETLIQICN